MWLVSCRRQRILTQGPAQDCFLCMMGDGIGGAGYYLSFFFTFPFVFCFLMFAHSFFVHDFQALQRYMQEGLIKHSIVL